MERRLAVILAADMVGYSRLMEADEAGVYARQRAHLDECIAPEIERARGRIFKQMGDGLLAEFASVVDAVGAAAAIQRAMAVREAEMPEARRILYRIGVNLGDVIVEGDDLLGEGVNIAARLEQAAEPGGICVSGAAYDQLKAKLDIGYAPLGEIAVKNLSQPVRAYRVLLDPDEAAPPQPAASHRRKTRRLSAILAGALSVAAAVFGAWFWIGGERATIADDAGAASYVAILPFRNLSDAAGQDHFVAGVTEDIATALSQTSGLKVKAGGAVKQLAADAADRAERAAAAQVGHLLEGSIRRDGANVRVTARLVDAASGAQIWAERFDRTAQDVFAIQDEIAGQVATALARSLGVEMSPPKSRAYTPDIRAYDAYVLGRAQRIPPTLSNLAAALESFRRAMEIDPKFAGGYAGASYAYGLRYANPATSPEDAAADLKRSLDLAETAVKLDPAFGPGWAALAEANLHYGRHDAALEGIRKAMKLAPSDALIRAHYGRYLGYVGRPEDGAREVRAAMRMSPDSLPMLYFLGVCQRAAGDVEAAIETLVEHRARLGGRLLPGPTSQLVAAYVQAGRMDEARALVARQRDATPGFTLETARRLHHYQSDAAATAFLEALRQAGAPD